jgi:hypothetical protein
MRPGTPGGAPFAAPAPAPAPGAPNDGKPPVWDVPAAPKPGAGGGQGGGLRGFGIGFGIALMLLAAIALILVIALSLNTGGIGGVSQPTSLTPKPTVTLTPNPATPTATPLPPVTPDQATALVNQFYASLASGAYQQAYGFLGGDAQKNQSLDQFQQQWHDTVTLVVDTTSLDAAQSGDNVQVSLSYVQVLKSGDNSIRIVQATLLVGYDHNRLSILNLQTTQQQVTPTPEPTQTAVPTPVGTPNPGNGDLTPTPNSLTPTPTGTPGK